MEYATLSNGIKMPMLGFGTFQIDPASTKEAVLEAVNVGTAALIQHRDILMRKVLAKQFPSAV